MFPGGIAISVAEGMAAPRKQPDSGLSVAAERCDGVELGGKRVPYGRTDTLCGHLRVDGRFPEEGDGPAGTIANGGRETLRSLGGAGGGS